MTNGTGRRKRRSPPDWGKFYANGIPKEVIEIEDTPPPQAAPPAPSSSSNRQAPAATATSRQQPTYDYRNGITANGGGEPDGKRRKLKDAYESHEYQTSYSSTQTPHLNGTYSSPTTVSAQSSNSSIIGTTGASSGARGNAAQVNGAKRKRVTRQSHAQALAANNDAFANYHPPPYPPIKAKEVYVKPVRDVSLIESSISRALAASDAGHVCTGHPLTFVVTDRPTIHAEVRRSRWPLSR